jgi:hypothetical protein
MAVNQYRPWESEGITEVQYWKRAYFNVSVENGQMADALWKIANPIKSLLLATPQGCVFDGESATRITDNPHWAREIAQTALPPGYDRKIDAS